MPKINKFRLKVSCTADWLGRQGTLENDKWEENAVKVCRHRRQRNALWKEGQNVKWTTLITRKKCKCRSYLVTLL